MRLNFVIYFADTAPTSAKTAATSSIRFEKPHSLSYHEDTLTSVPSETGEGRVEDRARRVVVEVGRDERLGAVLEDP